MISAPKKSCGKTIISLGILYNLVKHGNSVQSFKKGPDFIDPKWLKLASKKECRSLDPFLMGQKVCLNSFTRHGSSSDMVLIEGNHGLHDGMSLDGSDSSAGLASFLESPVLLVINSRGMNRGAAALVKGMQKMIPEPKITGVILNHLRSKRQEDKQRLSIENHCGVPVVGAIPQDKELTIPERYLGLTTVEEMDGAEKIIEKAGDLIDEYCNMNSIKSLFEERSVPLDFKEIKENYVEDCSTRIGVFSDPAFCFYYPENLEELRKRGAKIFFINSLIDSTLPEIDGLYIGGGFPESFFKELSGNYRLLSEIKERINCGLPVFAECGGLIYLSKAAHFKGSKYKLAGGLPFEIGFQKNPVGYGYISLKSRCNSKWFNENEEVKAHEFHYSKPIFAKGIIPKFLKSSSLKSFQFDVLRGHGIDGSVDGILHQNLFASFAHFHASTNPGWAKRFVEIASEYRH